MPLKHTIKYKPATVPITEPVTKFGGQPVWIGEPRWPLSRMYGTPMQFICQIAIPPDLFPGVHAQMAYIFMSGDEADYTWEPDSGENAVILQPGAGWTGLSTPARVGPTLYRLEWRKGKPPLRMPVELAVGLQPGEDPAEGAWDEVHPDDEEKWNNYLEALTEDKIGGTAVPNTNSDRRPTPGPGSWRLLLQLNTKDGDPFFVNFAPDGVGWAFISEDGWAGKFMWSR